MQKLSRRSFLKTGLAAAGSIGVSGFALPASARGADAKELATLIDIRKCVGCCADICPWRAARKLENGITRIHSEICLGGQKCKAVVSVYEKRVAEAEIIRSLSKNGKMCQSS